MKYRCFFNNRFWYFVIGQIMSEYELKMYNEACLNGADFHLGTGISDKDGKEIFENDTISNGKAKFIIKYSEGQFMCIGVDRENKTLNSMSWVISDKYAVVA